MITISKEPQWIDYQSALKFLSWVRDNPTWWLKFGIGYKYLDIRIDCRTGSMLFASGITGVQKEYLNFEKQKAITENPQ